MSDSQENIPVNDNPETPAVPTVAAQPAAGETPRTQAGPTHEEPQLSTRQEIVDRLKTLVEKNVEEVKDDIENLKQTYYKLRKAETDAARQQIEENNPDEGSTHTPEADPLEETLKSLLNIFKEKKAELAREQEHRREENLTRKKEILDRIKALVEDPDNISRNYPEFQQLQQAFKEITDIPPAAVGDLWKNYQLNVEHYYDLLKINKELRDYDFKKNLDQKLALCEAAEALAANENVIEAFKTLQTLHEEWKGTGPVAKELREELWTRFKAASTEVNKHYQQHFEALKAREQQNEEAKTSLCVEIEAIDTSTLDSFSQWEEKTKEIIALQERWRAIGFAPRKVNTRLFERFRKSCDQFFNKKSEYFKSVKDEMTRNLEKKKALCEKAEALKDSTDWKSTTDTLVALQKEWKTIGPVARKYSDTIWKRFVAACDHFFEQKALQTTTQRQAEQENLERKKDIIARLEAIGETIEAAEAITQVRTLMAEWNQVGYVPFKEKDKIYKKYQAVLDKHFGRLNMQETQNKWLNYTATVQQMATSDQARSKLGKEREKLLYTYERLKTELQTYENNIGFLTISTKGGNTMLKEMERKMQQIKEQLQLIEKKVDLIDQNLQ
ncbi:MAG: DUF349 domain-containing protein [Coprobacter sp.]|nr:DUF349 domain-containing protein [Coprobacter sp.]